MHGLWGMGQMMFSKYIVAVDEDCDVHNTSEVLFRLCANTDPRARHNRHQNQAIRSTTPRVNKTSAHIWDLMRRANCPGEKLSSFVAGVVEDDR